MDCRANSDVFFLPDEKFDFDVSLSPTSSKEDEDEDEVFIGPLSHKEKCVSVNVVSRLENNVGDVRSSWSPLTGDQLDAVCQEAHKLADKLQSGELSRSHSEDDVTTGATTDREQFVQDAQAKMGVLGQTASALSPVKRETFCVQDSPMKLLPPAVQRRMLRGSSAGTASSARPATAASSTRPAATASSARPAAKTRLSTSSPVPGVRAQPRMGLRGKAVLGVVLPSKPAAPTPSCSASKSRAEKGRLQPPTKAVGGWKRSPSSRSSSRPSSRAASCEDLLSDSASVASDISDSSLNSSLIGKRTLAPPTKNIVRNVTGVKAVPPQSRRVSERKNTSSSSSSVSSFNSSISLSPAKGKLNSSLNRSLNGSTGPASSSVSIQANKPRRSTIYATAEPASANASRRSLSTQARKPSEVERVKAVRSTPLKRAEATPLQATPAKRLMERTASIPTTAVVRPQTGPRTRSKPEALVPPTPSGGSRGAPSGDDGSKMLKPKRLMSASNVDSLPQKPSVGPLTPSAGSCRLLQVKARRPSALPTPVRRRMSSIPVATPTNPGRTARPPSVSDCDPAAGSASPRTERSCSPAPVVTQEEAPADAPDIQPFCLEEEEEEHPAALPSTPPQSDQSESTVPEALSHGESEPNKNLIELETAEESNSKTQEVLLLDLPAPTLQPQEKLLIDLTNTPNLIRTSNKSCTTTQQLIDLSSPLIKWSPEDKRENNAPLINLSF